MHIDGTVELEVRRRNGELKRYVLHTGAGRVELEERSAPDADARITGSEQAWIAAFGPEASSAMLEITGDRSTADALLDALSAVSVPIAAVA